MDSHLVIDGARRIGDLQAASRGYGSAARRHLVANVHDAVSATRGGEKSDNQGESIKIPA